MENTQDNKQDSGLPSRPLIGSTARDETKQVWYFECRNCQTNCVGMISDPPHVQSNYCSLDCAQKDQLNKLRAALKHKKYSYASIARSVGKSASQIGMIMRGDYPFCGANKLPKYMREWFEEKHFIIHDALITW
jgi:hypothetical protein